MSRGAVGRLTAALALTALVAACGRLVPDAGPVSTRPPPYSPSAPPYSASPPPAVGNARQLGLREGPAVADLSIRQTDAAAALLSFRESCPRLTKRTDGSGLTRPSDWKPACDAFATWPYGKSESFFATFFETLQVGDGRAFATGYFEPEIAGSRTHVAGYDTPVYGLPRDLVRARAGDAPPMADWRMPLGRYDETGRFTAYFDRAQIENGALAGRGLEIAWVRDPVDFFFLQVQGSGRLRLRDGGVMRIGYAGQNGQAYTGIGAVMRDRGLVGQGPGKYAGSMQGIVRYIRENPADGRALMRENRSWVFFREMRGAEDQGGPVGALGVPIRAESSVAIDPAFVPLGAPVWLDLDRTEANGLWIAQDTGGAIKGANRFDTFWGAGEDARHTAGGMSGRGRALILVPKGTLARLGAK